MNVEQYNSVFSSVLGVNPAEAQGDVSMEAIEEWDSLAHMDLMAAFEEELDIMISPDELLEFTSYEAGKKVLAGHGIVIEE